MASASSVTGASEISPSPGPIEDSQAQSNEETSKAIGMKRERPKPSKQTPKKKLSTAAKR